MFGGMRCLPDRNMKMQKSEIGQQQLEYLARSPTGLWIKGFRTDEKIEIFWQPRFKVEGGKAYLIDANGEVESCVNAAEVQWGDLWRLAGTIPLIDEMVKLAGIKDFESFVYGLMRHCVELIARGFGEEPEEVVSWFVEDFSEFKFVAESDYKITSPHGEFMDLDNEVVTVSRGEENKLFAEIVIGRTGYEFEINEPKMLVSFIISTIPV
jgi:hypothetical protein